MFRKTEGSSQESKELHKDTCHVRKIVFISKQNGLLNDWGTVLKNWKLNHRRIKFIVKMKFSLILATLLCFATWINLVHPNHGPTDNCWCHHLSTTRVHRDRIVDYTVQKEGVCTIKAIIFQTVRGKRVCSDPSSSWAKTMILVVDEKKATLSSGKERLASSSIMTTTTASTFTNTTETNGTTVTRHLKKSNSKRPNTMIQKKDDKKRQ
ncbi:lymphotactin-like [Cololabis saira]|uniref:lymphotactin-like n=1 Tax=Cololabis saira TaxID=129043 RepID=UPI002AD49E19|nr:lymphotactin-like [Cololabis saira]